MVFIKRVTIKILGIGVSKAFVTIFDNNNRIVYKGTTNGIISLCLNNKSIYKINICYLGYELKRVFVVNNYNNYEFIFDCSYYVPNNNKHNITLLLTDYYYNNLPIQKGDIILNG